MLAWTISSYDNRFGQGLRAAGNPSSRVTRAFSIMVNVLIQTDTRYPVNRKIIRKAIEDTFKKLKIENAGFEVSVAVVGQRKMKALANSYLQDGQKHQILTFALEEVNQNADVKGFVNPPDGILRLGDIVLCWPLVLEEASRDEMLVDEKVCELVNHGVEHLFGRDHE